MNKAFLAVPCAMGLVGITLVVIALNAGEEFRLLGATFEKRFGFVLGGVGILGAVAVASVMLEKMKGEAQGPQHTAGSHRPRP